MIQEFPIVYQEPLTFEQAKETMLRWGRFYDLKPKNSLVDCMIAFQKHYDECVVLYEEDDDVDVMMETWRYEINAYNTVFNYFQPLFAPQD